MTTLTRIRPRGGRIAALVAALTMTAALAACSSDSESSADSSSAGSYVGEESDLATSEAGASEADGATMDKAGDRSALNSAARAPAMARHVISTGTVSLVSDDVSKARQDVQRIVDTQHGWVTEENTETDDEGTATYSRLVIRVPANSFAATMTSLEKAAELRQSQVSSEDVTTQVIDTDVRVRAQEGSLKRVEQLLARADSLKDIIWIESQLTTRQAELDSLKSQQAWLTDQTSDSTITIDIARKFDHKVEKDNGDTGFLAGLKGGMKALGGFAVAMATIVGALLPFAIVLTLVGVPLWLLVRRSVRRARAGMPARTPSTP